MTVRYPVVFLVDVDNTLLDNDRCRDDLQSELVAAHGEDVAGRYWLIQERRFAELGYRDYLGAVQEWWEGEGRDSNLLRAARFLLDYPFAERLYPGALDAAGIAAVVDGRVLVYVHKELSLEDVEGRYPAERYVLVDDKLRILTAAKQFWGERVTTVLPLQGQFATDPEVAAAHPSADLTIAGIGELAGLEL